MRTSLLLKRACGLTVLLSCSNFSFAQLSGPVNVGAGQTYTSLTGTGGLFDAINTGGLSGNVTAVITSDLTETGTVSLNQWSETPASSNFTLNIVPGDTTEKLISGTSTTGMVTLNGADRVYINGSFAGSGRYLRLRNSSTGTTASTLTLTADAKNDTIANCIFEGASSTTSTTNAGAVIYLGPGSASGNDNNALMGNLIREVTGSIPNFLLKSVNSTTTAASSDNNFIYDNEFANFNSMGTYIGNVSGTGNGANGWTIRKNAYYQQAPRTTALTCIQIATGFSHLVDSNNIGGSNASRGGAAIQSSATPFYGINITSTTTQTSAATPVTVTANNISNIYLSATNGVVYGIYSTAYSVIQDNIVGQNNLPSDTIRNAGTSNMGIMVVPASTIGHNIITGNSIKNMRSASTSNVMSAGVNVQKGTYIIDNNTIDSISSGTGAVQTGGNALCGINVNQQSGNANTISGNIISNLILTHPTIKSCAVGIETQNNSSSTGAIKIFGNKISNIMGLSSAGNVLTGIYANFTTGVSYDSICNNMIMLGTGTTALSQVQGITDASNAGTTHTCANNTVVITGVTDASATATNVAYFRRNATTSTTLRNNIFINLRTTTGTGTTGNNYAVSNDAAATTTSWKSDYNLLYNVDPARLVYWQPTATAYDLAGFKAIASSDTNSVNAEVPFVDMANGDLHINAADAGAWNVYGRGIALSTILTDFDGNPRSITTGIPTTLGGGSAGPSYRTGTTSTVPAVTAPNNGGQGEIFTALQDIQLDSVGVWVDTCAGTNLEIQLLNSSNTVLSSVTVPVAAHASGSPTKTYLPVNFSVPAGTDYRIIAMANPDIKLGRQNASNSPVASGTYPFSNSLLSITSSIVMPNGTTGATINTTNYYFFYNLYASGACANPMRQVVTATVTPNPLSALPDTTVTCNGTAATLNSGSAATTWTPTANLYTDAAATTAYTGGAMQTVYAKETTAETIYAATTSGDCTFNDSVRVDIQTGMVDITSTMPSMDCGDATAIALTSSVPVTWTLQGGNLYTDANGTTAYSNGTTTANVFAKAVNNRYVKGSYEEGGCMFADSAFITVNNPATTVMIADDMGAANTDSSIVNNAAVNLHNAQCELMASIAPTGGSPVSGWLTGKVIMDASVQNTATGPYATRHFELTPAMNSSTAAANITLYFTQAEFDAYNTYVMDNGIAAANPLLPAAPGGSTNDILVDKFNAASGSPGPTNNNGAVAITPTSVTWDAANSWWAVTFPTTGFSGFFLHTSTSGTPLPIVWKEVSASLNNKKQAVINWSVSEKEAAAYHILKSTDGSRFEKIATVISKGNGNNAYFYTEGNALNGKAWYRIAQVSKDGKEAYSKIMELQNSSLYGMIRIYPNPATQVLTVETETAAAYSIYDLQGKVILKGNLQSGKNTLHISSFAKGFYTIKIGDYNQKIVLQ